MATGDTQALLIDYRPSEGWTGANLNFVNLDTGKSFGAWLYANVSANFDGPALLQVDPGHYRLVSGQAATTDSWSTLPLLEYWFKDFEIGRGEIVDLGVFLFDPINARSDAGILGGAVNFLMRLDVRDDVTYVAYSVDSVDATRVDKMLAENYPALVGKPVKRPLQPILDKDRFTQIVTEAYQPDADGKLPATGAAEAKLERTLKAYLNERLRAQ